MPTIDPDGFPIRTKLNDDDKIIKVLIHENLFDKLAPLYNMYCELSSIASVSIDSNVLLNHFDVHLAHQFSGLIQGLSTNLELGRLTVSIKVIKIIKWAAKKGIGIASFVYRKTGTVGQGSVGSMRVGGGPMRVDEQAR